MITWTATAFTAHTTTDAIYTTSAEPSLTAARRAAGDAALAALDDLAGHGAAATFLSITIDGTTELIASTVDAGTGLTSLFDCVTLLRRNTV